MTNRVRVLFLGMVTSLTMLFCGTAMADDARALAEDLNQRWNNAFNSQSAGELASLYASDAVVSPGNGKTLRGREAIEDLFQGFFDNGLHDHSIEIIKVHREGNTLYEVARWQAHGQVGDDGKRPVYGGILVNHFRRNDAGQWQSLSHVWNMQQ